MSKFPGPFEIADSHTEWSVAAFVMENLVNTAIKEKHYDLGPARVEKIGIDRKRPDGVIYVDPLGTRTLINIEFKQPFFDPFDFANLKEPAREKAVARKAPYFATCNFRELVVFRTENVNKNLPEERQIVGKYHLSEIYDLNLVEEYGVQISFKKALEKFLEELIGDFTGKKLLPPLPLDELLIYRLHEKIKILSRYYQDLIKQESQKPAFAKKLARWFVDQNWNFTYQEEDYERAARQTAYLLVNKILFYDVLRSKRPAVDKLAVPEGLTHGGILKHLLQGYFEQVLKNIDYETIYSADFIDELAFPDSKEVVYQIKDLIEALDRYNFLTIGFEIIGRIFEKLIPLEERRTLGQYFTNPDVADIILKFALRGEQDKVFDPACGAGTFLVRAYQHKKMMNRMLAHEEILKTLWGNDIAKFPAHLTTINLAINDLSVEKNYPRVVQKDFFAWLGNHQAVVELPESSRKVFLQVLSDEEKEQVVPRYFDCLVGNPPYTRQEDISDISGESQSYKENLISVALRDLNGASIADISARAGLYTYFFIHGTKFLQNGGRFGFIVSNSWLDVDYGKGLQEFFLENYKIIAIIESKIERWFEAADINTCIVLLEKASGDTLRKERDENLARFVYLKKPLRHFIPSVTDIWEAQAERLAAVDNLLKTICAHREFYENDDLRIFPKSQKELWEEGFNKETQKYEGAKWGKYLRAPSIFFKILEKAKDKLVPLKEVAEVRRGFTTGANEFFYLTEEEIKRRGIEKEFWMHQDEKGNWLPNYVIKSPKECQSIIVNPRDLKYRILMIHKDREELKGTNVLQYIQDGERRGFHERETCVPREKWYELTEINDPILSKRFVDTTLGYFFNEKGVLVGDTFFTISARQKDDNLLLLAVLNSTLGSLLTEIYGRTLMGEGVLLIYGPEIKPLPVLNPKLIDTTKVALIKSAMPTVVESIFVELRAKSTQDVSLKKINNDRRKFDQIIMGDILRLTEEEQLEVYRAVVDLVKSRIERAKSVEKKKVTKNGFKLDLMVETILKKADTRGLGVFYKRHILPKKLVKKVKLPKLAGPVKLEKTLLDYRLSSGRESVDCSTEEEGKYLKVFLEAGWDEVFLPEDSEYLKQILPKLEKIASKMSKALNYYTDSILDPRLKEQISRLVWQKASTI